MRSLSGNRLLVAALFLLSVGCSKSSPPPTSEAPAATTPAATGQPAAPAEGQAATPPAAGQDTLPDVPSPYDVLPPETRALLDEPFTGDFDQMVKRRLIRAGVVFNRTQYYVDKGVQRGTAYEAIKLFEEEVNKRLKTGLLKVNVAFVPLSRDQLFPALSAGKVDLVAAGLTVTPERQKLAAFSNPTRTDISEIPVTAPGVPPVATADDLSGREVFVRKSSSYYESIVQLNQGLASRGRAPVTIKEAPEALEDDDILEMVNAGLVDTTIVDDYAADFWHEVFTGIVLNKGAAVRSGGELAVAVRKDNPKLLKAANIWIREYGPRTAFGNLLNKKYLQDAAYVKSANNEAERKKFMTLAKLFETYGGKYGVDYILMAAQGYQESRLDQQAKSHVGAVGIMQLMPATGKDMNVGDITQVEPNIHAGVKYFRFMMDQYYKGEPMTDLDKALMTFASYNAGPGRIRQLRKETARHGLDPNVWFGNVERIVSEKIGRETVQYVSNIFKYYVAYKLSLERREARDKAKTAVKAGTH